MHLALNPNLTDDDICEILKRRAENSERLIDTFKDCYAGIDSPKQKATYLSQCLPIIMMSLL